MSCLDFKAGTLYEAALSLSSLLFLKAITLESHDLLVYSQWISYSVGALLFFGTKWKVITG